MNASKLKPGDQVIYRAGQKCNDMKATVVRPKEPDLGLGIGEPKKVTVRKRTREVEIEADDITKKLEPKTKAAKGAVGDDAGRSEAERFPNGVPREFAHSSDPVQQAEAHFAAQDEAEAHQASECVNGEAAERIRGEGDGVEEGQAMRVREATGPGDRQADLQHDADAPLRACPSQAGTSGAVVDGRDEVGGGLRDGARVDRTTPGASKSDGVNPAGVERNECAIIPEALLEKLRAKHYVPDQNDDDINAGTDKYGESVMIDYCVKKTGERFWRVRYLYKAGAGGQRIVTGGDGQDDLDALLEKLTK